MAKNLNILRATVISVVGMEDRIRDLIGKIKETRLAIGEVDGLMMILKMRAGYLDDDKGDWVVEAIIVSGSDVAAEREFFSDKTEAGGLFERLKSVFNLQDADSIVEIGGEVGI